jgi:aspartate/methionine/tyrosine aminotransferase
MTSLTQLQRRGRSADIDLADAHANQTLKPETQDKLLEVFARHMNTPMTSRHRLGDIFFMAMSRHTGQPYHPASSQLIYSASCALAVTAKLARLRKLRSIGIITPTADSVPRHFTEPGMRIVGVPQEALMPGCDFAYLDRMEVDVLVVVTPNNPTGGRLSRNQLGLLLDWAARCHVLLILDMCFRMLDVNSQWDIVNMSDELGADVVVIDDTGKILPVGGIKASVMSSSKNLRSDVAALCNDLLLSVPDIDALFLEVLLREADEAGEVFAARQLASSNLAHLADTLATAGLPVPFSRAAWPDFQPTVSWIDVGEIRDQVSDLCNSRSLSIADGNLFYWDQPQHSRSGAGHIRVALLRDPDYFQRGLDIISDSIMKGLAER